MNIDEALKRIQVCVSNWIAERPQARNITRLADITGFSRVKLSRVLSGETKIDFSVAVAILDVTAPKEVSIEILERCWPREYEFLRKLNTLNAPDIVKPNEEEQFLSSSVGFEIFFLAARENGTSAAEVQSLLGRQGLTTLTNMENAGILTKANGRFVVCQWLMNSPKERAAFAKSMIELGERSSSAGDSWTHVRLGYFDSVNFERFQELEQEFIHNCEKLMSSSPNNAKRLFGIVLQRYTHESEG